MQNKINCPGGYCELCPVDIQLKCADEQKERAKELDEKGCEHDFRVVYKGDVPIGKRCILCREQVWF